MKKNIFLNIFLFAILILAGCNQKSANINMEPLPNKPAPVVAPTNIRAEELTSDLNDDILAQNALKNFFTNLNAKNYAKAINYIKLLDKNTQETLSDGNKLEESWENYESFSLLANKSDRAKLLEDYCSRWDTCLKAKIIASKKISEAEYQITVRFAFDNGRPYKGDYNYPVKKINGLWYVARGPLYHP